MKSYSFTKRRLVSFVCCALLPVIAIGAGVWLLIIGVVFNWNFAITFCFLPLIAGGFLGWRIFINCKMWKKIVLSGVSLILFLALFLWCLVFNGLTRVTRYKDAKAVRQYETVISETNLLPDLLELGDPSAIECYKVSSFAFIFSWETDHLICRYTQEEYDAQKARLDSVYEFETKNLTEDDTISQSMIDIDGYHFRMLSPEEHDLYFPKNVFLIGYSDTAREIAYLEFYDGDLDYIDSLKDFINDDCGWKHIR